jgi:hypothetical protein
MLLQIIDELNNPSINQLKKLYYIHELLTITQPLSSSGSTVTWRPCYSARDSRQAASTASHRYVSIRQHTSAYVSIRQHTSAYISMRQHTSACVRIRQHTSPYVSMRQHTSAYVSMRQHTSAYVSIRQRQAACIAGSSICLRFSCFTSTKVQILTLLLRRVLRAAEEAARGAADACGAGECILL